MEGAEGEGEVVKTKTFAKEEPVDCEIIDNNDGTYSVRYTADDECDCRIEILFENDKGEMVQTRGSPYRSSFIKTAKAADNVMGGGAMDRHIKKEMERIQNSMTDEKKNANPKDKDLKDVKVLLNVKECVEGIIKNTDKITLEIDQLDESLKLFHKNKQAKDS